VPPCAVIPVLIYPDPTAAADWLSKAFGFTVRLRMRKVSADRDLEPHFAACAEALRTISTGHSG
jgi:uncharacterized glyoxalase superfamily protein PhnB